MTVIPGIYQHYKGGKYEVLFLAIEHDTREELVVYQALYGDMAILVRPLAEFIAESKICDKIVKRYSRVEE